MYDTKFSFQKRKRKKIGNFPNHLTRIAFRDQKTMPDFFSVSDTVCRNGRGYVGRRATVTPPLNSGTPAVIAAIEHVVSNG